MIDLLSVIDLLSTEVFLPQIKNSSVERYVESIEEKAVENVLKHRVLTVGDESRIGFYLRAKALDEELSFFETGVAILSIAIAIRDQIEGENSEIITENMRSKGCRTIGEFLFLTGPAGERIVKHSNLTGLYVAEFNKIWKKQFSYNNGKYSEERKRRILKAVFPEQEV